MADSLYYVVNQTWVARMTDDGARAEYRESTGRWVPTKDIWLIHTYGRRVNGEEEALRQARPPFPILPGIGIGPFHLGMTEGEVDDLCREYGLRNEGAYYSGLNIGFKNGRAIRIEFAAHMGLSLADEPLMQTSDRSNRNVRRLLNKLAPPGPDWTEMDGLVVSHWGRRDAPVFSFMVYAPGHRTYAPFPEAPAVKGTFSHGILGRTGIPICRLGLPTSYEITTKTFEYAIERGVNYFYWGWMRDEGAFRENFVEAMRNHSQQRDQLVIAAWGALEANDSVLQDVFRNLRTDYLDILLLSLRVALLPRKVKTGWYKYRNLKQALKLKKKGLVRYLGVIDRHTGYVIGEWSAQLAGLVTTADFDVFHVQYNASTPLMESRFLDRVVYDRPPAVVAYGAAYGDYLKKCRSVAKGDPVPTWEDCYRFALSHPAVSACMCSAATPVQLDRALAALNRGPMSAEELARMRQIGQAVAQLPR